VKGPHKERTPAGTVKVKFKHGGEQNKMLSYRRGTALQGAL